MNTVLKIVVPVLFVLGFGLPAAGQTVPRPGDPQSIYYGEVPRGSETSPVIVFVHGLRGQASNWWVENDMYRSAYDAGYRTAFIDLSFGSRRDDDGILENSAELRVLFRIVARHYDVRQFYLVTHSKGGLDTQAALMDPAVSSLAKAVFMISPPNHGSELADWAFGEGRPLARLLGLLSAGVFSLKTDNIARFRAAVDPVSESVGIPYFTITGTTYRGNPFTAITGRILERLTGKPNDGFVTTDSSKLHTSYATDLGEVPTNHFMSLRGHFVFDRIHEQIQRLEVPNFDKIADLGFGDRQNSFAWAMKWFKGHLYVGTGRSFLCVTAASTDQQRGTNLYGRFGSDVECPPDFTDMELAAEIWRYEPVVKTWERVFVSPEDIPIAWDESGSPTKFTARDIAFRGMATFVERDGTEALYVSGVAAGSIYERIPPYDRVGFPPPRILRSVDGVTWEPLPQDPGTFLGEISRPRGDSIVVRGFRSMVSFKGRLFVTASDYRGVGVIVTSDNPSAGNDEWELAGPTASEVPAWTLHVWNDHLWVSAGNRSEDIGYAVFKTAAEGSPPFVFQPVVTNGAYMGEFWRSPDALSLMDFEGRLYVGSDRPTEMIRINPDDSWELVAGFPRLTPDGLKRPLSGMFVGFNNTLNGHFWRQEVHNNALFLGTWDATILARDLPNIHPLLEPEYGFDLLKTHDGVYWNPVTTNGLGDPFDYGVRTLEATPYGLFIGTANPYYGLTVWQSTGGGTPDFEGDPTLTEPAAGSMSGPAAPARLEAMSEVLAGGRVVLSWDAVPGATSYEIYRAVPVRGAEAVPADAVVNVPEIGRAVNVAELRSGALHELCRAADSSPSCAIARMVQEDAWLPGRFEYMATANDVLYEDAAAPRDRQARYFVRALDGAGRRSAPSNVVGGPSAAAPVTLPALAAALTHLIDSLGGTEVQAQRLPTLLNDLSATLRRDDTAGASRAIDTLVAALGRVSATSMLARTALDDAQRLARQLSRNAALAARGRLDRASLLAEPADLEMQQYRR